MEQVSHAIEYNLDVPDPKFPRTKEAKELRDRQLEFLFERVLDVISEDLPITDTNGFAQSGFTQGELMRWVFQSKERKARYREAQKIGMEIRQQLLGKIAQGTEMSDVQRDKLEIDTHKWRRERLYREQYASSTNIDVTNTQVNIDIRALIEKRVNGEPPRLPVVIEHDDLNTPHTPHTPS
jgi:hypothetical protein